MAISGAYFDVLLVGVGALLAGGFTSVSGLGMEADYEVYTEGGSNYPRFFFKNTKPQRLVLEQLYFSGRVQRHNPWHVIIAVDESGFQHFANPAIMLITGITSVRLVRSYGDSNPASPLKPGVRRPDTAAPHILTPMERSSSRTASMHTSDSGFPGTMPLRPRRGS